MTERTSDIPTTPEGLTIPAPPPPAEAALAEFVMLLTEVRQLRSDLDSVRTLKSDLHGATLTMQLAMQQMTTLGSTVATLGASYGHVMEYCNTLGARVRVLEEMAGVWAGQDG